MSDDLNRSFEEKLAEKEVTLPLAFSIYVLQACAWPLNNNVVSNFIIPSPYERALTEFEAFYGNKFNGRKLTWLHHLSTGEVRFNYTKKNYTVVMGTYHISLILLFEDCDVLTFEEIQVIQLI